MSTPLPQFFENLFQFIQDFIQCHIVVLDRCTLILEVGEMKGSIAILTGLFSFLESRLTSPELHKIKTVMDLVCVRARAVCIFRDCQSHVVSFPCLHL